jgi:hypothetical protein
VAAREGSHDRRIKGRTMSKSGSGYVLAFIAVVALLNSACASGSIAESASAGPTNSSSGAATPTMAPSPVATGGSTVAQQTPDVGGGRLVVLADGPNGGRGLWSLGPDSQWAPLGNTPNATAIGRTAGGLALVTGAGLEIRKGPDLSKPGNLMTIRWAGTKPTAPIVGVEYSSEGRAALVMADDSTLTYAVAGSDGTFAVLTPAPTQSFSPLVAWMNENRVIVLSTDNRQVSRLAVIDVAARTMTAAGALSGVRVFAASADGKAVAAATEGAVYVAPIETFTGSRSPEPIVTLADRQVVWGLALDGTGSRLFMLSGSIGGSGSIGDVHELGYTRQGSSWQKFLDSGVPFGRAVGQVFLAS